MDVGIGLLTAAAAIAALLARRASKRRAEEQVRAVAAAGAVFSEVLGAQSPKPGRKGAPPAIDGSFDGVACRLAIEFDKRRRPQTIVRASPTTPLGFTLEVRPIPPGGFDIVDQLAAGTVHIGDEMFDRAFVVHAEPDDAAQRFLSPPVRASLVGFAEQGFSFFEVTPQAVLLTWSRIVSDVAILTAALELVTTAAQWQPIGPAPYR